MSHSYSYARPAVTVDAVVFGVDLSGGARDGPAELRVLLVQRAQEPCRGMWALPGGYVNVRDDGDQGEDLEDAARRELREETSVQVDYLEQLCTVGTPGRDPRGRVITVAYMALVRSTDHTAAAGSDAQQAKWLGVRRALEQASGLAFDHAAILRTALARLQGKVRYAPVGFSLLPTRFTIPELQAVYETILERPLDRGNFRRGVLELGLLKKLDRQRTGAPGRAPDLYQFDRGAYARAARDGFRFDPVPKAAPRARTIARRTRHAR